MRKLFTFFILGLLAFCFGCAPGAVNRVSLYPEQTQISLKEFLDENENDEFPKEMERYGDRWSVYENSDIRVVVGVDEYKEIIEGKFCVENLSSHNIAINASMFSLFDKNRFCLGRREPHEVANYFASFISAMPQYQPKYNYKVTTSTSGYVYPNGYFNANSRSTVYAEEDPYNKLGYSMASVFVAAANNKVQACADRAYRVGLSGEISLVPKSKAMFSIFWKDFDLKEYPIRILIHGEKEEFRFYKWRSDARAD